uniref:Peptidase S1 domain-containing protein n=1 Tax=Anopheles funestus TaxID=62324 RepID=A0A1Y9HEM4_ANOFN
MFLTFARLLLLFGLLSAVSQTYGEERRITCGRRRVKSVYLIHNGIDAKAGHWPWHVAIFHKKQGHNEYACGGVIVDENTVLTAAHCVYTTNGKIPLNQITVNVGQIDLKEESEYKQTHNLSEMIVHPRYGLSSIVNDIALLKLSTNITMTKYVQPVCLWTMDSNQELIVGRNGTVVGFGLNERDVVSNQLKQALIGVVDPLTCIASDRAVFGTHLTSDMYCGKGQTGVSACNGDSGGGMFFEVGGKWFVRGLVSFTPLRGNTGLCDPLKYTAYTDVAKHFEWIVRYVDNRVLSFENDVLDIDYDEKLRLFNFGTCGVTASSTQLNDGSSWTLPWLGFVIMSRESNSVQNTRCVVTLISDWYAIGPAHCFDNDGVERWILLGATSESSTSSTQVLQIERIITHPKYNSNSFADNIVLIELLNAANTTVPNVRPICIPATPELRTNKMINLSVASFSTHSNSYGGHPVRLANTDHCKAQYADLGFTISWNNKRFCAEIVPDDGPKCNSLRSGAPLQELRTFGSAERYFLRGFEMFGLACATETPPVYNNLDEYLDWLLYNMQYNMRENAAPIIRSAVNASTAQTLETEWVQLQQQPGKENLRLFNMNTCGLMATRYENLGKVTILPWVGFFQGAENVTDEASTTRSLAVLISEWYALVPRRSVQDNISWRLLILGKYNPDDPTNCLTSKCELTHQFVEIRNVILPPRDYPRQMVALLELLTPANLTIPYIRPICLPFMEQLHRRKPTEVVVGANRSFNIVSKKLTMIDYLNCQQRLLLQNYYVTFDGDFPCAIEAEKLRQIPLPSALGSPYGTSVRFGGRTRYFLYGMDTNEETFLSEVMYGPYLFGTIETADLDWVLKSMQFHEHNTSLPSVTDNVDLGSVSLAPLQTTTFKRNLFNFNTCGINNLLSVTAYTYPNPWIGNVFSNAPFFNLSRCSVTLISEWYAVGPAYCFVDPKQEHVILFGVSGERNFSEIVHCAEANMTTDCEFSTQRILVQNITFHPAYDRASYRNDIALIKLARAVDTSQPNVRPICLPILDEIRSYNRSSLAVGSSVSSTSNSRITAVGNRYINPAECHKRWKGLAVSFAVGESNICVISKLRDDDDCISIATGSSMHTVQELDSRERHFLRGFDLFLPRGCSLYYPAVYLNTDDYLSWILENMDDDH